MTQKIAKKERMPNRSEEEILIELINEAIPKIRNKRNEISRKRADFIGYGLGFFLTEILKGNKDFNFRGKWIDDVEWKSRVLITPTELKGAGSLWWGPKKDYSKLYSEKFYAELTIESIKSKVFSSYFFRFQINGKSYELKR
jgi:hypothetical protein